MMNQFEKWSPVATAKAKPEDISANIDIEQGVLGAILLGAANVPASHWVERLTPLDFSAELHSRIYAAICSAVERGQVPTPILIGPAFTGELVGNISVGAYMGRLMANAASVTVLSSYVTALREMRSRRELLEVSGQAAAIAANPIANLSDCTGELVDRLDSIRSTLRERKPTMSSMPTATRLALDKLGHSRECISTGLASLDHVLGGWHRRELAIIAARPSMGKSAFLFSTLLQAAKRGTSSLIFSLEMPTEAAVNRMLSDMVWNSTTPIPYVKTMRGEICEHDFDRLRAAAAKMDRLPIFIDDQPGLTVSEMVSRAKRLSEKLDAEGKKLDVVAVDHLGKVRASDRYAGNKVHETGEKSNALAEAAKDLDVCMIAACQLNRGVEGRENKRPQLPDLRDTGDIEQDAETVMFLYRPAYYLERTREDGVAKEDERKQSLSECQNTLETIIAKNRNGPCTTVDFFIDIASNAVRDMTRRA